MVTRYYKVKANNEVHTFGTQLTEKEFYNSLDGVYGIDNWQVLEINFEEN